MPYPSEQSSLLPTNGNGRSHHIEASPSIVSLLDEETSQQVSKINLFSDVIVAASIHLLANDVLERQFLDPHVWFNFWFRIFLLHSIWSSAIVSTHSVFTGTAFKVAHHVGGLVQLMLVACFAKASHANNTRLVIVLYFLGRGFAAGAKVVVLHALGAANSHDRHGRIQILCLLTLSLFLDCGPLLMALSYFGDDEQVMLWGGLVTAVLGSSFRIAVANTMDNGLMGGALVKERHEFIILLLLGKLLLAGTTSAQDFLGGISFVASVLTAFGCFTLYFTAHVKGKIDAFSLSPRASSLGQQLHLLLFAVIPTMAIAFSQIIAMDQNVLTYLEMSSFKYRHPQTILSIAVAVFLVIMAELENLSADPFGVIVVVSKRWRFKFIMGVGVVVGVLSHYNDNAMLVAAVSTLFTAIVQLWFVQLGV
jgi:hypothetical protein